MLAQLFLLFAALAAGHPDFSGTWKLTGRDVTLHITHRDPELTVETLSKNRHALQRYTTDGKESVSTGIDGDEFHSTVIWHDDSLVFAIEEHEDGKILKSTETWSVLENGAKLQRQRVTTKAPNGQTLIYTKN